MPYTKKYFYLSLFKRTAEYTHAGEIHKMPNVTAASYWFHKLEQQVCHQTPSHVGNGEKATYVTKELNDSIDCRALTLQRGLKGFKEEKAQAGSSFH